MIFGPVLDVGRKPRWGRLEKTYGEDTHLIGEMGVAAVVGMQGDKESITDDHVAVALKHYCGYGEPVGGLNCSPVVSAEERDFRAIHLYPFRQVITRVNPRSIMPSYDEIDEAQLIQINGYCKIFYVMNLGSKDLLYPMLEAFYGYIGMRKLRRIH